MQMYTNKDSREVQSYSDKKIISRIIGTSNYYTLQIIKYLYETFDTYLRTSSYIKDGVGSRVIAKLPERSGSVQKRSYEQVLNAIITCVNWDFLLNMQYID